MPFLHTVPQNTLDQVSPRGLRQYKKLGFAIDFLKELNCLHRMGLVHSDIKPDNVMMLETDKSYRSCLIDFGFTGPVGRKSCGIKGSLAYMPPWVLHGIQTQDNKMIFKYENDIYAAGVLMFELFIDRGNDSYHYDIISTVYHNLIKQDYFSYLINDRENGKLSTIDNSTPECLSQDGQVTEIDERLHEVFTSMIEVTPGFDTGFEGSINFLEDVINKLTDIQSDIGKLEYGSSIFQLNR